MRIVSWNVNHGGVVRSIPEWLVPAIAAESPDVLVCTEYVRGPQHVELLAALRGIGLRHSDVTAPQPGSANCVLVAAREALLGGPVQPPPTSHPSVLSGFAHAILEESGIHVFAVGLPDAGDMLGDGRPTCEWLTKALEPYLNEPAIIIGDLDGAAADTQRYCGDQLEALVARGWRAVAPPEETSEPARPGALAFVSPPLRLSRAEYSWRFAAASREAPSGRAGVPERAMLLVDVERVRPGAAGDGHPAGMDQVPMS